MRLLDYPRWMVLLRQIFENLLLLLHRSKVLHCLFAVVFGEQEKRKLERAESKSRSKKVQMNACLTRTRSMHIFKEISFVKPQNDT